MTISAYCYLFLIVSALFLFSCKTNKPSFQGTALKKHATLEGTSFTKEQLNDFRNYVSTNFPSTGIIVMQDGKVLFEYGDLEKISYIASCRKSVLSILYGKYVEDGSIDLDEEIGNMGIDEKDGLLAIEKKATVDHIITSRSGVFHIPANGGYDENNILARGSVKPGEYFVYNNWDFNVAGYILEHKSGNSVYQELENQLAIPLGFEDWNLKNQRKKHSKRKSKYPAYHIYISTRDMAKIGQLMLNKGSWEGKQIISKSWVEKITSTVTPLEVVNQRNGFNSSSPVQYSYGYMWWLLENLKNHADFEGTYTASGYGGQYITVIPKKNIVIAHKTKLKLLTLAGLKPGGVHDQDYWRMVYKLMTNKKEIAELIAEGKTVDDLIMLIKSENLHNTDYDFTESTINSFGYRLMWRENYQEALKIFKLNTELFPEAANTFDSLGECLLRLDKKQEALTAYKKSLKLNPDNSKAREIIKNN